MDSQLINWNEASKYPRDPAFYCQKTLGMQAATFIDAAVKHVRVLDPGVRVVLVPEGQRHKLKGVGVGALLSVVSRHEEGDVVAGSNSTYKKAKGQGTARGEINDGIAWHWRVCRGGETGHALRLKETCAVVVWIHNRCCV